MKTKIKTTVIRSLVLTAMLAFSATYAQETQMQQPPKAKPNELGVRYSNLTGYGVAYQRNFLTHYYVRTTAWFKYYEYIKGKESMPIYEMRNDITYNFGLDIQRNIIEENKYRVAGFIGGGYAIREKTSKSNVSDSIVIDEGAKKQRLITAGLGGDIEYFFFPSVSVDLGVSYKFDYDYQAIQMETTKETGLGTMIGLNLRF
ncbi:MAG: hypothetical protein A2487_20025 [Candidatus Raymondbacteria bacterium RifOxyC12_full_50_8]|uniref:Outer membrane protein beta-barrel domain-containing protein n=1 Tax=Candidatus Raymondbacteria bacterium RIFOXYD12_FULL_49_13 TaxID=1817890 RepID=A0A1F7F3I7_UNCRA|nr:MAG: hypothetical protein A2248_10030 [Candidatus Raymondbacteria bacterium RIFOXYA2_FULL_49_16]OGJ86189.1 MAG: hypothetical protein A2350_18750 [Candidatus Raymondbacteria bacterium RifOxyB12_full_50_8]OGK01097.1 MAG: hypothetical protein A2519_20280 [Candidatus Raymondbacteria bacterium RIFOXYD12_FULL_49_13]OGK02177.1 MAG: hypothetical protein A2487_20025 [Candidatus Raymondbacteria bacterium RifOxyC12_full_50_8]OGP39307.1 MAG: hypothetical protein A2324_02410 [Candidatus Raymondbacteria b